ncbi:hypothetical protein NSK_002387 [Nannochloropsis salina CCMP1776]|uniref:Uncharacterized protein n=1 Tax=Nannochloropsis salina CCMP1776 TaxID=1027361 RepID=A0A4D9DCB2_9STRA|nr:hypothetical protein NSK_002387 [Nannochloropsis salina CCMP1776]|eukprot:TFJ86179.1 hypothetical protein NSK_002387 [Nannochloropsis salina CCMP1776]
MAEAAAENPMRWLHMDVADTISENTFLPLTGLSPQDVLISFMKLVREGHPAALEAQNIFQRDNNQVNFLAQARALLEEEGVSKRLSPPQEHPGQKISSDGPVQNVPSPSLERVSCGDGDIAGKWHNPQPSHQKGHREQEQKPQPHEPPDPQTVHQGIPPSVSDAGERNEGRYLENMGVAGVPLGPHAYPSSFVPARSDAPLPPGFPSQAGFPEGRAMALGNGGMPPFLAGGPMSHSGLQGFQRLGNASEGPGSHPQDVPGLTGRPGRPGGGGRAGGMTGMLPPPSEYFFMHPPNPIPPHFLDALVGPTAAPQASAAREMEPAPTGSGEGVGQIPEDARTAPLYRADVAGEKAKAGEASQEEGSRDVGEGVPAGGRGRGSEGLAVGPDLSALFRQMMMAGLPLPAHAFQAPVGMAFEGQRPFLPAEQVYLPGQPPFPPRPYHGAREGGAPVFDSGEGIHGQHTEGSHLGLGGGAPGAVRPPVQGQEQGASRPQDPYGPSRWPQPRLTSQDADFVNRPGEGSHSRSPPAVHSSSTAPSSQTLPSPSPPPESTHQARGPWPLPPSPRTPTLGPTPLAPTDKAETAHGDAGGGGNGEDVARSLRPRRVTRDQQGRIWVLDSFSKQASVIRPKAGLLAKWEAPAALFETLSQPEVALFRLGVASNTTAIISKAVQGKRVTPAASSSSPALVHGTVSFYAPRSAGVFVFRLFDAKDPVRTHATSQVFLVEVRGRDVEGNLRLISSQLKERKTLVAGLSQYAFLLRGMAPHAPSRQLQSLLWTCLLLSVQQIKDGAEEGGREGEEGEGIAGGSDKPRSRYPVIIGVAAVLQAALQNRFVLSCLEGAQVETLEEAQARWCLFNEEFYPSEADKLAHYRDQWGLAFRPVPPPSILPKVANALTEEIESLLPALLPSQACFQTRENVRARVEALLPSQGPTTFPDGTRLRVFGSSANNFGNDAADLDMCVTFPDSSPLPAGRSGEMIEALASLLEANGMEDVVARPTARIPIVLFREPGTGLDCDISVENPLALRNTQLLHEYSRVDPRVRALAYIVKHWARARKINNASGGTLSSYAYILMVLHFLQTAAAAVSSTPDNPCYAPLVPNLQLLPPDWKGNEMDRREQMQGQRHLPRQLVTHPLEGMDVDTYFYTEAPSEEQGQPNGQRSLLREYAARNKACVGELLVAFFWYYSWEFDYRDLVLSVRMGGAMKKERKAEEDGWAVNSRLAIEDPFETWYNVTHFLKEGKHRHIRQEFARAYALCVEEAMGEGATEAGAEGLLARICEEAPDPPARKETMEDDAGIVQDVQALELEEAEKEMSAKGGGAQEGNETQDIL